MKTPITDRLAGQARDFVPNTKVLHVSHARRLELDRAALMEALEAVEQYLVERGIEMRGTTGRTIILPQIRAALSAARANFPEP